jgi:hypothetical protein
VEAGRKGGKLRARRHSLAESLDELLLEREPGVATLREVAKALLAVASNPKHRSCVDAARILFDRLDGPISLGLDAFIGTDRTIIMRVGADGAPVTSSSTPPALPDLGPIEGGEEGAREVWSEVAGESSPGPAPSSGPSASERRALPSASLGLGSGEQPGTEPT